MSELLEYKCPNCGGGLEFSSELQKMKCPYCESVFEMEEFIHKDEALGEEQPEPSNESQWEAEDGLKVYSCESCGAQIITQETTGATHCPYCDNPIVMKGSFAGELKPDLVIPFKLDKKEVMKQLSEHLKGKKLLPSVFKDQHHIEEVKAIYVPYWLFDGTAKGTLHATGKVNGAVIRHGDYLHHHYKLYDITRSGNMSFTNVPVDGSKKLDDALMQSLEPFHMEDAVDFQTAYLAGYLADRYDVDQTEGFQIGKARMRNSLDTHLRSTVTGYSSVDYKSGNQASVTPDGCKYALYPVWILDTKWNGETYRFAMNGQTGKFVGDLPMDKKKFWFGLFARMIGYTVVSGTILGLIFG